MLFFSFSLSLGNLEPGFFFVSTNQICFDFICQKPLKWTSSCLQVQENSISLFHFRAISFQFGLTILHTGEAPHNLNRAFYTEKKIVLSKLNKSTNFQKNRVLHLRADPKIMHAQFHAALNINPNRQCINSLVDHFSCSLILCGTHLPKQNDLHLANLTLSSTRVIEEFKH
uniref:Uncharacterized protein n=1 Tax=Sphaerodactylus townsendi TaxID=933632 RepID=A0ACB8F9X1_9SAUR